MWLRTAPWDGLDTAVLDARERRRARSFVRPDDGARYAAAHTALREILGRHLRIPAREVPFERLPCARCGAPHGRPVLAAPYAALQFSLSHSGSMVLIAVSTARVGADVQRIPSAGTVAACTRALHPEEQRELAARAGADRCRAFARIWTRKEAYLKALGTGLCRPASLDRLGTGTGTGTGPGAGGNGGGPRGWSFFDLPCGPGHSAAVAVRGTGVGPPVLRRLPHPAYPHSVDREGVSP